MALISIIESITLYSILAYLFLVDYDDVMYNEIDDTHLIAIGLMALPLIILRYFIIGVDVAHLFITLFTLVIYAVFWFANRYMLILGEADLILLAILAIAFPVMETNQSILLYSLDTLFLSCVIVGLMIVPNAAWNAFWVLMSPDINGGVINILLRRYDPRMGGWKDVTIPMIPVIHASMILIVVFGSPLLLLYT